VLSIIEALHATFCPPVKPPKPRRKSPSKRSGRSLA
jgi:hypothetical protein